MIALSLYLRGALELDPLFAVLTFALGWFLSYVTRRR